MKVERQDWKEFQQYSSKARYLQSQVSSQMVQCWKKNRYQYTELEEMFLINMSRNPENGHEFLARELLYTLNETR